MARATRSSKVQEAPAVAAPAPPPPAKVKGSKKRKRASLADIDEQPAAKQSRTDAAVKEETVDEQQEGTAEETAETVLPAERPSAGDVPIDPSDAQKILDVLEMIDTQGLLERVFPLPSDVFMTTPSTSSTLQSASFRALLQESSQYPLRVLRSAIQHLFPISSHPRSRPSTAAAQQLRFCNLALSLLDQASHNASPLPLDLNDLLASESSAPPDTAEVDEDDVSKSPSSPHRPQPRPHPRKLRYALLQHLPTGDWWTSLDTNAPFSDEGGKTVTSLATGHAELVAIFPSPPASPAPATALAATRPTPTLGSLVKRPPGPVRQKGKLPGARVLSTGRFTDYGPYASFAPVYEGEGVEATRDELRAVMWERERKGKMKEAAARKRQVLLAAQERKIAAHPIGAAAREGRTNGEVLDVETESDEVVEVGINGTTGANGKEKKTDLDVEEALDSFLTSEQVGAVKTTMQHLEIEAAVQELLERNAKALARLEELQATRLGGSGGGFSQVVEGSEEWNIAQGITDTLTVLASLRPRASTTAGEPLSEQRPPLIPPPSSLRKLHRTLPVGSSPGWYGTLPPTRAKAMRDDNTLVVKPGAVLPAAVAATSRPKASSPAPATSTAPPYANYYPYGTNQYRGGYAYNASSTTATGSGTGYYANAYGSAQAQPTGGAGASHYAPQQYANTSAGANASSYAYNSNWYSQYQGQGGGASGRATPVQGGAGTGTSTPALATSYAGFFNGSAPAGTQQQQQPQQRAVANTVAAKPYQPGTWNAGGGGYAGSGIPPTLPLHMRGATGYGAAPQTPGTPTPVQGAYSNYGAYQTAR